ncbi:nuclear transport factor 2 family protein [Aurantimonas sp. 22II-16-19i]|uniref:nuclear transport factor 2 family protein n=1 Tax=Aurantimonas sp. 22II-16-19i TaxID=1317114 RepID=UPI0009F7E19D|nr:nuclear transport factor 2 family protein [Aurantimonas sp. 22II-16-19i]ORE93290.1 Ring hydroxylating enzyme beta subunit [Aurantimonas sp. 22II-16-19i]
MSTSAKNSIGILDRLEIENAVHRLLSTYVHLLDDGKFDEVAELLQHAEMGIPGSSGKGRDGIEQFLINGVRRHADGTPRTWHSVSNVLIDISEGGKRAKSVSYFTVHQELEGFPLQPICTGRYVDQFEVIEGNWEFVKRSVEPRHFGELRFHVV